MSRIKDRYKPSRDLFSRVTPTQEEIDEYRKKNGGHRPSVYRLCCDSCGKRIWGSGLGVGSHVRSCKGAPS